ncbi:hypothetical protein KI387_009349, partial [Taxus chinensis]
LPQFPPTPSIKEILAPDPSSMEGLVSSTPLPIEDSPLSPSSPMKESAISGD